MENIPTDKQYPKLSKSTSGYVEVELLKKPTYILVIFVIIALILSRIIIAQ